MAQRVDFAFFPGVREENLLATLNKVYGHIRRNTLAQREFRDWLKDENLWNKDEMPQLLSFCDILTDGTVRLGAWAERFFAADTEEAMREQVYKRLCDENLLLVKYALEALDTEGGGRLHSTHELHRLLTSYVYPGKHVNLEPFKNWIRWAVVSGRVKMIGIRWGLTDVGKQAVPRMRTVDPDEFLEDEKAAAASPAPAVAAAPAPVPLPALALAAEAAKAGPPAAAKPASKKDDDPDEDLDLPPEAEPVDDSVFSRYEQQFTEPAVVAPAAPPPKASKASSASAVAAPAVKATLNAAAVATANQATVAVADSVAIAANTTPPQVLVRYVHTQAACGAAPLGPAEVVGALRDHGRTLGLGGGSLLLAHGIEPRTAQSEPTRHLFLSALVARGYALTGDGTLVDALVERTGGTLGPLALLLDRPEALVDGLGKWQLTASDPQSTALRGLLVDAAVGGRALKAQPDLPQQLAAATAADTLVTQLSQGLLRGAPQVAVFWLIRELVRAGVWQRPAATEIAFVPWRSVRLMAYRLRLVDSHFADGPAMLVMARRLCTLFPPGSVEAAALELLAPGDHLRFDCTRPVVCQQPCAVHRGER